MPAFVAGAELADLADTDDRIVVLTADLAHANRTIDFGIRHPDRFFNMGVAEQNMISIAAGMASTGLIPYAATFAAYVALLACEQIRTDCAYPGMPVRILAHHSGHEPRLLRHQPPLPRGPRRSCGRSPGSPWSAPPTPTSSGRSCEPR